jgi:hypothetical protein
MSNKKISIVPADQYDIPYHISFNDGMSYLYAYTMVPLSRLSLIGRFRSYPLHVYSPEDLPSGWSHDFSFLIVGSINNKIYRFPSWFAFQHSPVVRLTADWTEVLAD